MKSSHYQQLGLFDFPTLGLSATGRAIKSALNRAAAESKLSREEIAHQAGKLAHEAGISLCPGGGLSVATLNKWLDINAVGHMPTIYGLLVICQVLGNDDALSSLIAYRCLEIMLPDDRKYRDLGKATVELKAAKRKLKKVEDTL